MSTRELIIGVIIIPILIMMIKNPGYFKVWGFGKYSNQPDLNNSPQNFYLKVLASFSLIIILLAYVIFLFRYFNIPYIDIFIQYILTFIENQSYSEQPLSSDKLAKTIQIITLLNIIGAMWFISLQIKKDILADIRNFYIAIILIPFFTISLLLIQISSFFRFISVLINLAFFIFTLYTQRIWFEKHGGKKN